MTCDTSIYHVTQSAYEGKNSNYWQTWAPDWLWVKKRYQTKYTYSSDKRTAPKPVVPTKNDHNTIKTCGHGCGVGSFRSIAGFAKGKWSFAMEVLGNDSNAVWADLANLERNLDLQCFLVGLKWFLTSFFLLAVLGLDQVAQNVWTWLPYWLVNQLIFALRLVTVSMGNLDFVLSCRFVEGCLGAHFSVRSPFMAGLLRRCKAE